MRVLPAGDHAVLVELADLEETLALAASLEAEPVRGVIDAIPGARTLLVVFRAGETTAAAVSAAVRSRPLVSLGARDAPLRRIAVRYDGEDLSAIAELLGVSVEEVVRRHTGAEYTVAFVGFAPGFAYLTGGDPLLDIPRRETPRTRIPAGSVALAGTYSGVYPRESPGGWQLIGTTDAVMWDLERDRPALLEPGDRVRFARAPSPLTASAVTSPPPHPPPAEPVEAPLAAPTATPPPAQPPPAEPVEASLADENSPPFDKLRERMVGSHTHPTFTAPPGLEIVNAGLQTLFQDLGRPGHTSIGVSPSGALDPVSLRTANRLVGNRPVEAALEVAVGGLQARARGAQIVAVTGAAVPLTVIRADGVPREAPFHTPIALNDGDELHLGFATAGVRAYIAVRGGFTEPAVLGSRATDVLSGIGPLPVTAGRFLPTRPAATSESVTFEPPPLRRFPRPGRETVLDVVLGPRTDWLAPDAVDVLTGQSWEVTPQSNRVGVRLSGTPLSRSGTEELPSEGCVTGSIQVPPSGQPVLFLADHPVTGGYPVIGVVAADHLPLAGQLPVGAHVRFRVREPDRHTQPHAP